MLFRVGGELVALRFFLLLFFCAVSIFVILSGELFALLFAVNFLVW